MKLQQMSTAAKWANDGRPLAAVLVYAWRGARQELTWFQSVSLFLRAAQSIKKMADLGRINAGGKTSEKIRELS